MLSTLMQIGLSVLASIVAAIVLFALGHFHRLHGERRTRKQLLVARRSANQVFDQAEQTMRRLADPS